MSAVIDTTVVGAQALGYSSDERLISRLRAHDDNAFAQLVARYENQLLAFCRRMLGSREDAEDVLQDTFAAAYKAILADERVIEARPWLYQIARNRCLNAIRGRRPTQPLSLEGIEPEVRLGTAEQVAHRLEIKLLVNDILALPEQQRQALVLHELEGCSYEQIGYHLGTSVASVRSLLLRARRTLVALAEGRALPCAEARAQLDEADGPTPAARRHLEVCSDCAGHGRQRRRRSARVLRAISPFGLVFALKQAVLPKVVRRGVEAAAGGTGAAGAGTAATAGAGGAATAGAGLSAVAAKALAGLAVLAAAGTGTVVVQQVTAGSQHPARSHAAVVPPAATPTQSAAPVIPPAPPVSTPPIHRSPAPRPSTGTTTPSSSTPTTPQPTQPVTTPSQTSPAPGVQTTTTPAAAGRTRPVPGAGMSPVRTRPVPYQPTNSGRTFPQDSSTGTESGRGPSTPSSGQGSQTGPRSTRPTDTGQGSTSGAGSSQGSSGTGSTLSSPSGTGATDSAATSTSTTAS